MNIPCPLCGSQTRVIETRMANDVLLRRRRECTACRFRFSTEERMLDVPASVLRVRPLGAPGHAG